MTHPSDRLNIVLEIPIPENSFAPMGMGEESRGRIRAIYGENSWHAFCLLCPRMAIFTSGQGGSMPEASYDVSSFTAAVEITMRNTLLGLSLFLLSCESEVVPPPPPPEPVPTITLSLEDAGVTEVWLRMSIPDTVTERMISLERDGEIVLSHFLMTNDSVFVDEGLLPNHQYTYQVFRTSASEILDSTETVEATTMDTTSHEFTWEVFEFGDHSSSVLLDVAIIDENNIWAVGEIYLSDSTGQRDPEPYNLARWDGSSWNLSKVWFPACNASGNEIGTGSYQGRSILAFSPSDIWIASLGSLVHWDGSAFARICMPIGYDMRSITSLWGDDEGIYWGGTNGYLAYDGGSGWQQIATGTTLDINDIYGAEILQTGETAVLAVASQPFASFDRTVLRITGTTVEMVSAIGVPGSLKSLWFKPERKYYVAGDGMYSKRSLETVDSWTDVNATQYYLHKIRGKDINDVVVCGSFGDVVHYNGVTWRSYISATRLPLGEYYGVAIEDNIVVAVGFDQSRAIIARGMRAAQ